MNQTSTRPTRVPASLSLAFAAAALLAACGGGGGDSSAPPPSSSVSQAEATTDAADAAASGSQGAASLGVAFGATQVAAGQSTTALAAAAAARATATAMGGAHAAGVSSNSLSATIPCAGGGTASITISGGTVDSQLNGQFDAGETYQVAFAQCSGLFDVVTLNGSVTLAVQAVDAASNTVTATLTLDQLSAAAQSGTDSGSVSLDGSATLTHTETGGQFLQTTDTTHVTAASLTMDTTWNGRSGHFALTNMDGLFTRVSLGVVPVSASWSGHHSVSGTANGHTLAYDVSSTGGVDYDAMGNPVHGTWTVTRSDATITGTVANGTVTLVLDQGNDGTVDATWTFPVATLEAAEG